MRDALLFCRHHIARQHGQHCAVHGHRYADLVQRDLVEQDLHVLDRVDCHPGLAHVARHAGVVAVVTPVGGQVERHTHALPACGQRLAVERIGFFSGRKTCVLADRPGPHGIHGGLGAAQIGLKTRQRVGVRQAGRVFGGVQRLDGDAIGRDPVEGADIAPRRRLGCGLGPGFQRRRGELWGVVGGVVTHGKSYSEDGVGASNTAHRRRPHRCSGVAASLHHL
ncbi:hypothetical protein D3C71_1205000 [compost metagenome]